MGKNKIRLPSSEQVINAIDKLPKTFDLIAHIGAMYVGFDVFSQVNPQSGPYGALTGLIAYKLATSDNEIAGATGVATLGALGLAQPVMSDAMRSADDIVKNIETWLTGIPYFNARPSVPPPQIGSIGLFPTSNYPFWDNSVQYKNGLPYQYWDGHRWVLFNEKP